MGSGFALITTSSRFPEHLISGRFVRRIFYPVLSINQTIMQWQTGADFYGVLQTAMPK
jgi:hypothetical protein